MLVPLPYRFAGKWSGDRRRVFRFSTGMYVEPFRLYKSHDQPQTINFIANLNDLAVALHHVG